MTHDRLTRRRVLTILAAGTAGLAIGGADQRLPRVEHGWTGLAMGADARILFCGVDAAQARDGAVLAAAEIERLEQALSLFRRDSEICRLNADGVLREPSADFLRALALALSTAQATGGLFDPTVQPLWEAHADWFAGLVRSEPPPDALIAGARAAVDWRRIVITTAEVRLGPGQRVTLNGLGQGYVTDRVADLLRARGFRHVLVDLGEQRALGPQADGSPWLVARDGAEPVALFDGALATSEGAGCVFGLDGAAHHLFDPRTGRSATQWRRITVRHRSAAVADALSTALYISSADDIERLITRLGASRVWATDRTGRDHRWS